jgi:prepilin-type N-terminal cleavage/methylation domain-containing protein
MKTQSKRQPRGEFCPSSCTRSAFSLIEMLVTLAIILIMFVLLWGRGSSNFQKQQKAACQKNLHTLYLALDLYAKENKDLYPAKTGATSSEAPLGLLVPRYTTTMAPFICPGTKDSPLTEGRDLESQATSYAYYMGWKIAETNAPILSDRQINTSAKDAKEQVFSMDGKKPGNNHHKYGGNVLFTGGEVEAMPNRTPLALPTPPNIQLLNPRK